MFCKLLCILNSIYFFSCGAVKASHNIISPQDFTDSIHHFCSNQKFDNFVEWLKNIDETGMNRLYVALGDEILVSDQIINPEYLKEWKREHIAKVPNKNPFIVAVEFFPYFPLIESTALSFDELSPIIKMCIVFSAKYGNPIAQNILLFSSIEENDKKLLELIESSKLNRSKLNDLLETPFVWNNSQLMKFFKTREVKDIIYQEATHTNNPFIALNAYFVAAELNDRVNAIQFLQKAKNLGSALAFTRRLYEEEITLGEGEKESLKSQQLSPSVKAYYATQQARAYRYGIGNSVNRTKAEEYYLKALDHTLNNPSLYMEMANFYQDIFEGNACEEIGKTKSQIIKDIILAYKYAHDYGDGYAIEFTIIFLQNLTSIEFLEDIRSVWELSCADFNEILTLLYIKAYNRHEDEKFLDAIKSLGTRNSEQIKMIRSNTFSLSSLKESVMKWEEQENES